MADQSMIERVAIALRAAAENHGLEIAGPLIEDGALPMLARAAIGAMREPMDAIMEAGNAAAGEFFHRHIEVPRWHAMIDAALQDTIRQPIDQTTRFATLPNGYKVEIRGRFKIVYSEELFQLAGPVKGALPAERRVSQLIREAWNKLPDFPTMGGGDLGCDECICPKCGLRHGGAPAADHGF